MCSIELLFSNVLQVCVSVIIILNNSQQVTDTSKLSVHVKEMEVEKEHCRMTRYTDEQYTLSITVGLASVPNLF